MTEAAASLVRRPGDGALLCVWNRRFHGWALPGGKLEPGEDAGRAQARELLEETGLRTTAKKLVYLETHRTRMQVEGTNRFVDAEVRVHVFEVEAKGKPCECEPGCPVAWIEQEVLLVVSPFAEFYKGLFAT